MRFESKLRLGVGWYGGITEEDAHLREFEEKNFALVGYSLLFVRKTHVDCGVELKWFFTAILYSLSWTSVNW